MRITYDPAKNARNVEGRGLSFERIADLEWRTALMIEDRRQDYGEPRFRVIGPIFGVAAAESIRRGPGRPRKTDKKVNQTLRLDADVLEAYRRQGHGWQARMNQVLREHMPVARK